MSICFVPDTEVNNSTFITKNLNLGSLSAHQMANHSATSCKESFCSVLCISQDSCFGYQFFDEDKDNCVCRLINANMNELQSDSNALSVKVLQ